MDFTFCATEKQKNPLQIPSKILPPLLQNQSKQIQQCEIHPLNVYQLDRFVKPIIRKRNSQMSSSKISQIEYDSTRLINDQTQVSDIQIRRRREENSIEKLYEQGRFRQQSCSLSTQDIKAKKQNLANMFGKSNFDGQKQFENAEKVKIFTMHSPTNISIIQNTSTSENIHPNSCQSNFPTNFQQESIKKRKNYDRQHHVLPCSQSLSKGRDYINIQQKMSTLNNPTRQSYQSLLQGDVKINLNSIQLKNQNQTQLCDASDLCQTEENRLNHFKIQENIENQSSTKHSNSNLNLQSTSLLNNKDRFNQKTQVKLVSESLDVKQIKNKKDLTAKILANSNIAQLPLLSKLQNNKIKIQREYYKNFSSQSNHSQFIKQNTNLNKPIDSIQSNQSATINLCKSIISHPMIAQKQKDLVKMKNQPEISIIDDDTNASDQNYLVFKKINSVQDQPSSPKTEPLKPANQLKNNQNQLDQLQNPDWFYNQLGRPNIKSYQEKREKAIERYKRNIFSQQSKQNEQLSSNQSSLRQKLIKKEMNLKTKEESLDYQNILKDEECIFGYTDEEFLIKN